MYKEDFAIYSDIWSKNEAALDGKPIVESYLIQYPAETDEKYQYRLDNTSYHNLPSSIATRWEQIFVKAKKGVQVSEVLAPIEHNIDGSGGTTPSLARDMFNMLMPYGVIWALIDLPVWVDRPENPSEADRLDANIYPYVALYSQPNIIDWDFDNQGNLIRVVSKSNEYYTDEEGNTSAVYYRYTPGLKETCIESGKDLKVIGEPTPIVWNGEPVMPWVCVGIQPYLSNRDYFKSPINALVDVSLELYNRCSSAASAYDKACFCSLALGAGTDVSQLGFNTIISVPADDMEPKWIQPEATIFKELRDEIARLISDIFTIAGVKNKAITADSAKSGVALSIEDRATQNMVQLLADTVERAIREVWAKLKLANSTPDEVVDVQFPEAYDVLSLEEELEQLKMTKLLENEAFYIRQFASFINRKVSDPELRKEILKYEASKANVNVDNITPETINTLISEGILSIYDIVRMFNPDLATSDDKAIAKWINNNKKKAAKIGITTAISEV